MRQPQKANLRNVQYLIIDYSLFNTSGLYRTQNAVPYRKAWVYW